MLDYRNFNPAADTFQEKLLTSKVFSAKIAFARKRKTAYGGIAQLGERLNGIQEVSGSIPLISTNKKSCNLNGYRIFCFSINSSQAFHSYQKAMHRSVFFAIHKRKILLSTNSPSLINSFERFNYLLREFVLL